MRKISLCIVICLLALFVVSLAGCKKEENNTNNGGSSAQTDYVDLGLPSGTKWKDDNEIGNGTVYYTYDEAVSAFGDRLPTREQCEELRAYCTWERQWQNNGGYKITGPNGNSIVMPFAGARGCDGHVSGLGYYGIYWSSTPLDSENGWCLDFNEDGAYVWDSPRCEGYTVRLVQD